ncbi:MAG: accessory factor UbiK family protein [Woeseia sp.]
MEKESIDQLARRLAASVPEGLRSMRTDLEENFRSVLKSGLSRMDLVTREEFEVQQAVLARTRQQLEALEKRLDAIGSAGPAERKAGATHEGVPKKKASSGKKKSKKKKAAKKDP